MLSPHIHRSKNFALCVTRLTLFVVASVFSIVTDAYAQPKASSATSETSAQEPRTAVDQRAGRVLELYVCGKAATFDLEVYRDDPIMLNVEQGITKWARNPQDHIDYILEGGNKIYIMPDEVAPAGAKRMARIWSKGFEFTAHLTVIDKIPTHSNIIVKHVSEGDRLTSGRNPCNPTTNLPEHNLRLRAASRHGRQTEKVVGKPEIDHVSRSGDGPDIHLAHVEWEQGQLVVDMKAVNSAFEPSRVTHVEVIDKDGEQLQAELWPWPDTDKPGAIDGASSLHVMGGDTAHASVYVRDVDDHSMKSLQFKFHGLKGGAPFMTAIKVYRMVPVDEDGTGKGIAPSDARWKHLTVALRGNYGGFWVPRGIDLPGARALEPTTTGGMALRVGKGLSQFLALEGEVAGGTIGIAEFEPGVTREGRYGRLIVQGVARLWYEVGRKCTAGYRTPIGKV